MGYHWDIMGTSWGYIYICMCMYIYVCMYVYIYRFCFVWLKPEIIVRSIRFGSVPLLRLIYTCLRLSKHFWRGSAYTCQEQHCFLKMFPDPVQWTIMFSNWKQTILGWKPQIIRKQWPTNIARSLANLHGGLCTVAIIQCALAKSHYPKLLDFYVLLVGSNLDQSMPTWLKQMIPCTQGNDELCGPRLHAGILDLFLCRPIVYSMVLLIGALDPWSPHLVNGEVQSIKGSSCI